MANAEGEKILVVGGGLVGSLWAYILKKRGLHVEVFEKRPDPKNLDSPAGRSINLVITSRGLHGLKVAGLVDQILPITVPVYGRQIHAKNGDQLFQPYGRDKSECNYSVSRWDLNKALIQACQAVQVPFHFEHEVHSFDFKKKELSFNTPAGQMTKIYSRVFATDGAGSNIRKSLIQQKPSDFQESVEWLAADYKELHMPAHNGKPAIEKNALHIWPRASHMMMGLANGDNSFTMTLYLPKDNHPFAFSNLQTEADVEKLFQSEFSDSIENLPDYTSDFLKNPQGKLATVRMNKWVFEDSVAFLGDAAHAIVPFFGQGMNLGFEDCTTLIKFYDQTGHNWKAAFEKFDQHQRPNANAIADMALENFIEMRDKVGDSQFQLRKKVEALIEKEFPQYYRSRYGLITYTLTSYALAREMGLKQNTLLEKITHGLTKPEDVNLSEVKKILETDFYPWLKNKGIETKSYQP